MKRLTVLLLLVFFIVGAAPIQVLGAPQLPASYWGTITGDAEISTGILEAVVGDVVCGSIAIVNGRYGSPGAGLKLLVQGDDLNGKIVSFRAKIGDKTYICPQTAIWKSGDIMELNLTLSGNTAPPPASQNNDSGGSSGGSSGSSGSSAGKAPVTGNQTGSQPSTLPDGKLFRDVASDHWAAADIQLLVNKGIIKGVSDNLFDPSGLITRAQFTALMVRALALTPDSNASLPFNDVAAADWYYAEVAAAHNAGLIQGTGATVFDANAVITREQMASMLIRALNKIGKSTATVEGNADQINAFSDNSSISTWARQDIGKAIGLGFMKGYNDGRLLPLGTANRAEAVTMLKRFMVYGQLLD